MGRIGPLQTTFTARGLPRYRLEVWHDELKRYSMLRGDNSSALVSQAQARVAQWDATWSWRAAIAASKHHHDQKRAHALAQTQEAADVLAGLDNTLSRALNYSPALDWETLKDRRPFPEAKPVEPDAPQEPHESSLPSEPQRDDPSFQPPRRVFDRILPSRREEYRRRTEKLFLDAHDEWRKEVDRLKSLHAMMLQEHEERVGQMKRSFESSFDAWQNRRAAFLQTQVAQHREIEAIRLRFQNGEPEYIFEVLQLALKRSQYPDWMPPDFELDFNPDNACLIVDFQLPPRDALPTLNEVAYVQSRGEFVERHLSPTKLDKLYDSLLYQITLRTLYELFGADEGHALKSVVFNGYVRDLDPANGQDREACILSVHASRETFLSINLARVDPRACFRSLKGIGSPKLHTVTPVAPIMKSNRIDKRFAAAYAVADGLTEGFNLAAMDWEDFEQLIRELFEEEFASAGGEVKVTRASRDGGIDAVVFDPDPIRGGKIVIQAKRYTNTVDVSAVRDLYGSVHNEGANKGILVTTADYGPDAHEFAKGKPLTLINGSNLLHLLEKHGHKARIDLREARAQASQREAERSRPSKT
jgi:restriction system protein